MTDKSGYSDGDRIYEACDFRLYFLDMEESIIETGVNEDCPDKEVIREVKRLETPLFFRFGMQ